MDAAKAQVLFDIALIALGALAVGLPLFAMLRRRDPEVGWHHHGNVWSAPFDRLDLAVAGILFFYFFVNAAAPLLLGDKLEEATAQAEETGLSTLATVVISTVFFLAIGAGVFSYATVLRQRDPVQLFGLNRLKIPMILLWTAAAMPVIYILIAGAVVLWKQLFEPLWGGEQDLQEVVKQLMTSSDPVLRTVLVVSAVVVAPVVEETIFRGFLYPVFKRFSDRFFAAAITSLLFAVVHGTVPGLLPLFLLALVLTAAYELSGCLWVPVCIHATFNGFQSLFMLWFGDGA